MYFSITDPRQISARIFDDEVVVAHFGTGVYYSLMGTAMAAWTGMMAGVSLPEIAATLGAHAAPDALDLPKDLATFARTLQDAGVIAPCDPAPRTEWQPEPPDGGWSAPQMEMFSDMRELLLLDPVHDASEAGWPYVVAD